jgi:hypothetical protein
MTAFIVKTFMTFVGLFFGVVAFNFVFILSDTSVYNITAKVLVLFFLLLMMVLSFTVSHVYKED